MPDFDYTLLIGSLFSGVVGAVLVFVLTTVRDKRRMRELTNSERNALLRLIDIEVYQNIEKLDMIRTDPDIGQQYRAFSELHTEHWSETRIRLTQLLDSDDIQTIVRYYGLIHRIGVNLNDKGVKPPRKVARDTKVKKAEATREVEHENLLSVYAREALSYSEKIRYIGSKYIGAPIDYYDLYKEEDVENT